MTEEPSEYLFKEGCDDCGSSDAKAVYSDGHTYCFSCTTRRRGEDEQPRKERKPMDPKFVQGEFKALSSRKLTEDTVRKYGYHCSIIGGVATQAANYRRDGELVAQKLRKPGKQFSTVGNPNEAGFYGQHLFREGGRMLVICEGEIDAMSAYQALGSRWPCVSLPSGAQGAAKVIKQELTWLESFEKIVLAFDMDDAGRAAVQTVAPLLEPGKVFVAELPMKDANECLVNGKSKELVNALWDAHPYRPDGVIDAASLWEEIITPEEFDSVPYPWQGLNDMTYGMRRGTMITITSGSGMGKSQVTRELLYHLLQKGHRVGGLWLEESTKHTALTLMGLHANLPLHLPGFEASEEVMREAFEATAGTGRLMLYDHWGSSEIDNIIDKIKFMASSGCEFVFLDHVSLVVSGLEANGDGGERKMLDLLMTRLRTVVSRFNICLIIVCHVSKPSREGGSYEEGRQISLNSLRGSASVGQLSDVVIGLERDQQAENPEDRNHTRIRILKNRQVGQTGLATGLIYDPKTGRLKEANLIVAHTPTQSANPTDDVFGAAF